MRPTNFRSSRDAAVSLALVQVSGPAQCKVCNHHDVAAIHRALVRGDSHAKISARFGLKGINLYQHMRKGHHQQVLAHMDRDARMCSLTDLFDSTRAVAEETLSVLRGHEDPGIKLKAIGRMNQSIELAGKLTGKISTGTITQFLIQIGARSEAELKSALALQRSGESVTLRDAFDEALALVRMALGQHPEWRAEAAQSIIQSGGVTNGICADGPHVV